MIMKAMVVFVNSGHKVMMVSAISLRNDFKYYFADFVRKGGGGYPPNP